VTRQFEGYNRAAMPETIRTPHRSLLIYYALGSLLLGPLAPVVLIPLYFRYHTLRYRFDDEGISMSWGILFRREITLTYSRIQDIHLRSNLVERWLGLAKVQIQTASGSSGAAMAIEGLKDFEEIRDFLDTQMRGAADRRVGVHAARSEGAVEHLTPAAAGSESSELAGLLLEIASEVRALRATMEQRNR
jgi:uncharacterized membrane protein YdbT with pleckstrin-like domain